LRFVGDHRTEAFVAAVKRIVSAHVGGDQHPERALLVADRVMRGCSRTLSGADSFFALHELFAAPELLVSQAAESGHRRHRRNRVTPGTAAAAAASRLGASMIKLPPCLRRSSLPF